MIMEFRDCVMECFSNKDFIREYNRLTNSRLIADDRKPIIRAIDKATGYDQVLLEQQKAEARKFILFVWEIIWCPLLEIAATQKGGESDNT